MRTSAMSGCVRALTQLRERNCTAVQDEGAHDGSGMNARRTATPGSPEEVLQQRLQALHVRWWNSVSGRSK